MMCLIKNLLNFPDLKMPVAIVTGGNKGIGLGVVSISFLYLSVFLAVQDSSITDIVCWSLGPLVGAN